MSQGHAPQSRGTDLTLIAAIAGNGVIGRNGALPWSIPADLRRFKKLTLGHPVIMGRSTFQSIGKPLPGRTNIVLTRDAGFRAVGVWVAHSRQEALSMARRQAQAAGPGGGEAFVIGGAQIYAEFLPLATRLDLTRLHRPFDGDVFFPEFDSGDWSPVWCEDHPDNDPPFSFMVLERRS